MTRTWNPFTAWLCPLLSAAGCDTCGKSWTKTRSVNVLCACVRVRVCVSCLHTCACLLLSGSFGAHMLVLRRNHHQQHSIVALPHSPPPFSCTQVQQLVTQPRAVVAQQRSAHFLQYQAIEIYRNFNAVYSFALALVLLWALALTPLASVVASGPTPLSGLSANALAGFEHSYVSVEYNTSRDPREGVWSGEWQDRSWCVRTSSHIRTDARSSYTVVVPTSPSAAPTN